jgi:biopolymer transport protein ExbB
MIKKLATRRTRTALVSLATLVLAAPAAFAQAATKASEKSALQTYVIDGGPTMVFIGIATMALIALAVYNYITLSKAKFVPDDLRVALMDHMINCRVRSAIELASSHPSYLGRMVAYSMPNIDATSPDDLGRENVEDAMADFSINEQRKNMMWINYISLVAQAAPMLGLLGTVLGMVGAFTTLAESGQADPGMLAGDISEALLTTLWGLITAIPALLAYYFFKARLGNLTADAQHAVEEMLNASIQTVNQDAYLAKIPEGIAV